METIHKIPFYHTPGQYYGFVTGWAGFTPGKHEGKITGLAAHGDPDSAIDIFRDRISYSEDKFSFVNHGMWGWAEYEHLSRRLEPFGKADVAASVQKHLEDLVTRYINQAVEETGLRKVVLSGGIFANVKLNQRIRELENVKEVYIHPNMGDGGLGVGKTLPNSPESSRQRLLRNRPEGQPDRKRIEKRWPSLSKIRQHRTGDRQAACDGLRCGSRQWTNGIRPTSARKSFHSLSGHRCYSK